MKSGLIAIVGLTASGADALIQSAHIGRSMGLTITRIAQRSPATTLRMEAVNGGVGDLKRKVVASAAALLIALSPLNVNAASDMEGAVELTPAQELIQKTTKEQRERLKVDQQKEFQKDAQMSEGELIARVIVSIKSDLFALGFPNVSSFPKLDTEESSLIVTAFGRTGPPVAAKRLTLKGREFPVALELTSNDLAFPLTKDAWKKDARSLEDIGVAVVLDPDGKISTLDAGSLTGYAVSKQLRIGGQMERTEALVEAQVNKALEEGGQMNLSADELSQLQRLDAMLDLREDKVGKKGVKAY